MNKKQLRFSQDQISRADSIDLVRYAANIGFQVKRVSSHSYKVVGCGGLYIDPNTQRWNWFTRDKGGGPIQFVMEMEGKTWVEAVNMLLGENPLEETTITINNPKLKKNEAKGEFLLPEKAVNNQNITNYLNKIRAIDIVTINLFIDKSKLYENKKRNCIFVGFDAEGTARYGSARSTNTKGESFRADVKNSEKKYPFSLEGRNNTVSIFESPIDLMSYHTLLKYNGIKVFRNHMISLGGVCDNALEYFLMVNLTIDKIILCMDNDEAGHQACQQIAKKYGEQYKILRHCPDGKDFNEDLVSIAKRIESERSEEIRQASTL